MKKEFEIHTAQAEILNGLLFVPEAGFAELNTTELTSDHFSFHIKRLVELELVQKTKTGKYQLTQVGKEFANRFDTDEKKIEKQGKIAVLLVIETKIDGVTKYLYQERLKQPYYGFWGCMTGKIRWGEALLDTAARELMEETGLTGKHRLCHIWHKRDFRPDGELLEDKYFYVIHVNQVKGVLKEKIDGGRNAWFTEKEVVNIEPAFDQMDKPIAMVRSKAIEYSETDHTYKTEDY